MVEQKRTINNTLCSIMGKMDKLTIKTLWAKYWPKNNIEAREKVPSTTWEEIGE